MDWWNVRINQVAGGLNRAGSAWVGVLVTCRMAGKREGGTCVQGLRAGGGHGRVSSGTQGVRLVAVPGNLEAAGVTGARSSVAVPAAWAAHGVPGSSSGALDTDL